VTRYELAEVDHSDTSLLLLALIASNPDANVNEAAVQRYFGGRRTLRAAQFHIWKLRSVAATFSAETAAAATDDAGALYDGAGEQAPAADGGYGEYYEGGGVTDDKKDDGGNGKDVACRDSFPKALCLFLFLFLPPFRARR
jgi:hypothetical protein